MGTQKQSTIVVMMLCFCVRMRANDVPLLQVAALGSCIAAG